jgi:hypothetical protein
MSEQHKLERDLKFNVDEFNKYFEKKDLINKQRQELNLINKEIEQNIINQEIIQKKSDNLFFFEDLVINIKNLFFEILELLLDFKNPIPYILENEKREFEFAIMILLIGILLLFLSNLLI